MEDTMTTTRYAILGFLSGALLGFLLVFLAGGNISCTSTRSQEEQHIEKMRRFSEAYAKPDVTVFDELLAPNQITHINGATSTVSPDSFKRQVVNDFETYAEIQTSTDDLVAQGDRVAARSTWRGLRQKETGEDWEIHIISITRFENGKMVEYWSCDDALREYVKHGYKLTPPPAARRK
jgi:predicted ester cyclase